MDKAVALVMAGGSGTRFWPLSRKELPKQFLTLFGHHSLLKETIDRVLPLVGKGRVFVCSAQGQQELSRKFAGEGVGHFFEPEAKNTAPCLMWSVIGLLELGHSPDEVMVALPADHFVRNEPLFRDLLNAAVVFSKKEKSIVTLGITPHSPHTGYGYIEGGAKQENSLFLKVARFVEKPDLKRAQEFLRDRNYFWNAGIFVGTLEAFSNAFKTHMTESWNRLLKSKGAERAEVYRSLKSEPMDTAVMEREGRLFVLPVGDVGWSDVGSWSALAEVLAQGEPTSNLTLSGKLEAIESQGCLVSSRKTVALLGVSSLIVVDTEDYLLVANRDHDQRVKELAKKLDP